jgi:hypothetical protein
VHARRNLAAAVLAAGMLLMVAKDLPRWQAQRSDPLSWRLSDHAPGHV